MSWWLSCRVLEEVLEEHPHDVCPPDCQEEHAFYYVRLLSGITHPLISSQCRWGFAGPTVNRISLDDALPHLEEDSNTDRCDSVPPCPVTLLSSRSSAVRSMPNC